MAIYFPQALMSLRVILEDFQQSSDARAQQPYTWTVKCKRIRVSLNSYKEADTFEADIDYKNFPFDPRIIRACGVSIFLEDKEQLFDLEQGRRLDTIVPKKENIVFQGFVDTDRIQLSDDSRMVRLEGRDFTSLLIDREYFGDTIDTAQPLDKIIRQLLDELPQTKIKPEEPGSGLLVDPQVYDDKGNKETLPTLAEINGSRDALAAQKNTRRKRSYWDHIQELVENSGLIAYIAIDRLVITKPRNLYNRNNAKVFIYGRNVKSLEFSRKLGRQKGFNVRVVSLNVEKKDVLEAKIPEEATEEWCKSIGIKREPIQIPTLRAHGPSAAQSASTGNTEGKSVPLNNTTGAQTETTPEIAPYFTFRIKDVADKDHLVKIGEKIFEELGRQQIEGKLTTHEMLISTKVKGSPFPVTQFRVGTPIEVTIDQGDVAGVQAIVHGGKIVNDPKEQQNTLETKQSRIAAFLKRRGYNEKIADAFAISLTKFDTPFFTKSVEFSLDQDSGFTLDLDFINFIEIPQNLVEPTLKK